MTHHLVPTQRRWRRMKEKPQPKKLKTMKKPAEKSASTSWSLWDLPIPHRIDRGFRPF